MFLFMLLFLFTGFMLFFTNNSAIWYFVLLMSILVVYWLVEGKVGVVKCEGFSDLYMKGCLFLGLCRLLLEVEVFKYVGIFMKLLNWGLFLMGCFVILCCLFLLCWVLWDSLVEYWDNFLVDFYGNSICYSNGKLNSSGSSMEKSSNSEFMSYSY